MPSFKGGKWGEKVKINMADYKRERGERHKYVLYPGFQRLTRSDRPI